jgi:hypothetical protein
MARVFGVFWAFILAGISLGAVVTPAVVSGLGLNGALVAMAVAPVALGLLGYPALAAMDREAAERVAALEPRIAILEGLGIFASASRPILERLAAACTEVEVPARTAIVREGEPADAIYVIVEGLVEVTARGEDGAAERKLREMGPGTYFGEIGVLERIPRTATVTALVPCRLLRLDGDTFLDALTESRPSTSLLETARRGLARTHPSLHPKYDSMEAEA